MFVLRPIAANDQEALVDFAMQAHAGLTNLPKDPLLLAEKIDRSIQSFNETPSAPGNQYYAFALEDQESGKMVGTSAIYSRIGNPNPHYFFRVENHSHHSDTLHRDWDEALLNPIKEVNGPSEICSLFLLSDYRKGGTGRLLSLARFLFMANFPERFEKEVAAEMRGVSENCDACPFWNAVGRHFIDLPFCEVLDLYVRNEKLLPEILPEYPIHISLLPKEAQAAIGKAHPNTQPALKILTEQGFHFSGRVDIFDAGPMIIAPTDSVKTIQEQKALEIDDILSGGLEGTGDLIANTRIDFRACMGIVRVDKNQEKAAISREVAEALQVDKGDTIRFTTVYQ